MKKKLLLGTHTQGQPGIKVTTLRNTCNESVMLSAAMHAMSIRGDTAHARRAAARRGGQGRQALSGLLLSAMLTVGQDNARMAEGLQQGESSERSATQLHPSSDPPRAGGRLRFRAPRPPALLGHCSFRVPVGTEALPQSTAQQVAPASSQLGHTLLPLSGNRLRSSAQSGCKRSLQPAQPETWGLQENPRKESGTPGMWAQPTGQS